MHLFILSIKRCAARLQHARRAWLTLALGTSLGLGCSTLSSAQTLQMQEPPSVFEPLVTAAPRPHTQDEVPLAPPYRVTPLPDWVSPLPDQRHQAFASGDNRYLSQLRVVRIHDAQRVTDTRHEVLEINRADHPWVSERKGFELPLHVYFEMVEFQLHALRIHRGNRVIDLTHRAHPTFERYESRPPSWISLTYRKVLLPVPALRRGDRLELAYSRVVHQNAPLSQDSLWSELPDPHAFVGDSVPTVLSRTVFHWPQDMALRPWSQGRDSPEHSLAGRWWFQHTSTASGRQASWTVQNVPAQSPEPKQLGFVPSGFITHDGIGVSPAPEGSPIADLELAYYLQQPTPTSAAFEQLVALAQRESTPAQQAAAALRWTQTQLGYHLSWGRPYIPLAPDEFLALGRGDCKDFSLLLWHVMRRLGIEAHLAPVHSNAGLLAHRQPDWPAFDHIVVVVWIDGEPHVLDGTLSLQPQALHRFGQRYAHSHLRLMNEHETRWLYLPVRPDPAERTRWLVRRSELASDGRTFTISNRLSLAGAKADIYRGLLSEAQTEDDRQAIVSALDADIDPADTWLDPVLVEDDREHNRLRISYRTQYRTKGELDAKGQFDLDTGMAPFLNLITDGRATETRVYPLRMRWELEAHARVQHTLVLPEGWHFSGLAGQQRLTHPSLQIDLKRELQQLQGQTHVVETLALDLLSDRVQPQDFPAYLGLFDSLGQWWSGLRAKPSDHSGS